MVLLIAMDEHLIFYVDLLGTKSTIEGSDEAKIRGLEDLLKDIASLRAPFTVDSEERVPGAVYALSIKPEVSTLSDHIVLSLPTGALREIAADNYVKAAVPIIEPLIGKLAAQALELDLLVRGGATIGELYHQNGVVLGKALVEAYELESRVAIYPRIAVSRRLALSYYDDPHAHYPFLSGDDGIKYGDYFVAMLLSGGEPGKPLAELRGKVAKNIATFEATERWREMAKWSWFGNAAERAVELLPKEVRASVEWNGS